MKCFGYKYRTVNSTNSGLQSVSYWVRSDRRELEFKVSWDTEMWTIEEMGSVPASLVIGLCILLKLGPQSGGLDHVWNVRCSKQVCWLFLWSATVGGKSEPTWNKFQTWVKNLNKNQMIRTRVKQGAYHIGVPMIFNCIFSIAKHSDA